MKIEITRLFRLSAICLGLLTTVGCSTVSTPGIVFDTDMFEDYDDVGALAVLHKLADAGSCEILATVSSTRDNQSVATIELLNRYFGRPDIPTGAPAAPAVNRPSSRNYRKLAEKYAAWTRHPNASTADDAVQVYRRVLAGRPDGSVTVCITGFFTNFMRLLESGPDAVSPLSGRELVARKVARACLVGFMFPRGREYNIYCDPTAARHVLENSPVPLVFSGWDFGCDVYSGRKVSELAVDDDPVADMFRWCLLSREDAAKAGRFDHDPAGMGHNSYDQTCVLAAVLGADNPYFALERGRVTMTGPKGDNTWKPDPAGPHARMVERMPKRMLGAYLDELMAAGPLLAHHGVLCLTYDDSCFGDWIRALPLFAKYDAHATFYANGALTNEYAVSSLRKLRAAGHTVGLHTVNHRDVPVPFAGGAAERWFAEEVKPQLAATAQAGIPVRTFAYPNNRCDPESDLWLATRAGFTKFRTGAMHCNYRGEGPVADFATLDQAYTPVERRRAARAMWSFGIAPTHGTNGLYRTTRENVFGALRRASARNEIVSFFSHSIKPGNTNWIGTETEFLEEILAEAKRLRMKIVGFDELDL